VRTAIIAISILVIVSFVLEDGYGQMPPGYGMPPQFPPGSGPPTRKPEQQRRRRDRRRVKPKITDANDANSVIDPNVPTDANVILEKIEEFGLGRDLREVTGGARTESREWTRTNREDDLDLANAVNDQVMAELKFIRELAAEEGAGMTVAAIDGLIMERRERFGQVSKKLEKERERTRKKTEREERRRGGNDREGRTRDRDSRRRDRTRRTTPGTPPGMGMPPGM
jgi:hypothetical protein